MSISIIITAYNYGRFIKEAIHSALSQDLPGIETIVIDDGSTDNTPEIVAQFGPAVRYIRQENAGLPEARNAGLRAAGGDWVIILDADDKLAPNAASIALKFMEKNLPGANLVVFGIKSFSDDGETPEMVKEAALNLPPRLISFRDVVLRNRIGVCGLARRQVLLELGGFNRMAGGADDREMLIKLANRKPLLFLDAPLYHYRLHNTSMSHNTLKHSRDTDWVLRHARAEYGRLLPASDWRLARSIYHYQIAMNWYVNGSIKQAAAACARSIIATPWIFDFQAIGVAPLGRVRFLVRLARDCCRSWFQSSSASRVEHKLVFVILLCLLVLYNKTPV